MREQRRGYVAYLLRLWQVRKGKTWSWRASLERAGTGERRGFVGLDGLFAFLREQTSMSPTPGPDRETEENDSQTEKGAAE